MDCARLFALTSMAANDALIAVFDAKYTYNLWRPVTAIRNADQTNNSSTPRDASWRPLGDTPMHPEYPCRTAFHRLQFPPFFRAWRAATLGKSQ